MDTQKEVVYPLLLAITQSVTHSVVLLNHYWAVIVCSVYTQLTTPAAGVFTFVGQIGPLSSAPKENWAASRSRVAVPKGPE